LERKGLMRKYRWMIVFVLVFAMIAAACGDGDADETATTAGDGGGGDMPFEGTEVRIFGAFVSPELEAFEASIAPFEAETGIDIIYEGSGDFETEIPIRVEGGNLPDIAVFPQPGLAARFGDQFVDLTTMGYSQADVEGAFGAYLTGLVDVGKEGVYTGWLKANSKSLIWYPVPEFEEAGYEIPTTWDELMALSDQMVADGRTPWCFGMESSGATGWVATDWMEDIMLRIGEGAAGYDKWVAHEIPFNDPNVKRAAELLGEVAFTDGYVLGGTNGILSIPYGEAQTPMFDDPPSCWLHRQGSFITTFFPDGTAAGTDSAAFAFPSIDEGLPGASLGGGDVWGVFEDRPEVREVVKFLLSPDYGSIWAQQDPGFLSPHAQFDTSNYNDEIQKATGEAIKAAIAGGGFRFDASDAMPAEVGNGTFWTGMVEYIQDGSDSLDKVLADIEASWPSS
jgi:alpha-glucoside transport system substrate-binding protein